MVNIHEVKAKLSQYVDAAIRGESVVICNRNRPVVELRAIVQKRTEPRPVGGGPFVYDVPDASFGPLSDAELDDWDRGVVYPDPSRRRSRVAEPPGEPYGSDSPKKRRR